MFQDLSDEIKHMRSQNIPDYDFFEMKQKIFSKYKFTS